MPSELAVKFREELNALGGELSSLSAELADVPWRPGGWTRKQIVGHLLDSAANNRQRFVCAATQGAYAGPQYAQDDWVAAHGYTKQSWLTLLRWWQIEHEILAAAVDEIDPAVLGARCVVGDDQAVTLRFLIEDYIDHQKWHFKQLMSSPR